MAIGDPMNEIEIRNVLKHHIQILYTRTPEINREREYERDELILWTIRELREGPMEGGTLADIPTHRFGTYYWTAVRAAVLKWYNNKCYVCGNEAIEVHHIRPRSLNGKNHPRNLIPLCKDCHDEIHRQIDDGIQMILNTSINDVANVKGTKVIIKRKGANTLDKWTH